MASQPAAICSVYCHMLHMQPLCSQMQPTGSQMHPPRCPISARMPPCGQPDSTICSVFCNMLHMQRLCSQMQPTGSQIHPSGVKYQPRGSPVANQPAAICSVYCNTAAYEGPVQPNAAHRRPNAPPRCIISAPMQPKPIPVSPQATKLGTHGKPNDHPRTKNAPTLTPNSTPNAVMLQCSYGKKIFGAGGRGVSL